MRARERREDAQVVASPALLSTRQPEGERGDGADAWRAWGFRHGTLRRRTQNRLGSLGCSYSFVGLAWLIPRPTNEAPTSQTAHGNPNPSTTLLT